MVGVVAGAFMQPELPPAMIAATGFILLLFLHVARIGRPYAPVEMVLVGVIVFAITQAPLLWPSDAVALGYQFGYLILPAVTPVAMWILLNARFLEELVGWHGEPEAVSRGPTPGADPGPTAATESDDPAAVVEGRAIDGAGVAPVAAPTDEESKS